MNRSKANLFGTIKGLILRACILGVALLAVTSGKAWADTITINNGGSNIMGGVYVGPYNFTDSTTGQTLEMVCDTFQNDVFPPETWQATITNWSAVPANLGPTGPLLNSSVQQYEVAAYLTQEIFDDFNGPTANTAATMTDIGELQWALWDVFYSGTCGTGVSNCDPYGSLVGYTSAINNDLLTAELAVAFNAPPPDGNYNNILIYSPIPGTQSVGGTPQEYITTPEPTTLLLLGLGLMGVIALVFTKKTEAFEQA